MFFYFQAVLLKSVHWQDMLHHIPTCEQGWIYCPQMCEKWIVFNFLCACIKGDNGLRAKAPYWGFPSIK